MQRPPIHGDAHFQRTVDVHRIQVAAEEERFGRELADVHAEHERRLADIRWRFDSKASSFAIPRSDGLGADSKGRCLGWCAATYWQSAQAVEACQNKRCGGVLN
ncbi:Hypothetical protein UVM_LOCUS461 [uncultured virus]|nr:Hypothetical protein UVM_LOCUS461 [uncultured virus]